MRAFQVLLVSSVAAAALLVGSGNAAAVTATVPGTFSCTTTNCFIINNNAGNAINANATTASGNGLAGTATSGKGVLGSSSTGTGVYGNGSTGVFGQGNFGVYGVSASSSSTGNGVTGVAVVSGNGNAIYGDAGSSSTAWAGNFNGDTQASSVYANFDVFATNQVYAAGVLLTSDARLKRDIKNAPQGLAELLKLRPVTFKWKAKGDETTHIGLIAQEVQKVVPDAVRVRPHRASSKDATDFLGVDYIALLPVMIKAVQEQQTVIAQQEARIAKLERERSPGLSSLSTGLGGGLALAVLPVGLFVGFRRRKENQS